MDGARVPAPHPRTDAAARRPNMKRRNLACRLWLAEQEKPAELNSAGFWFDCVLKMKKQSSLL
jgi:hypothetical protein